jgi:hypothetical protein
MYIVKVLMLLVFAYFQKVNAQGTYIFNKKSTNTAIYMRVIRDALRSDVPFASEFL